MISKRLQWFVLVLASCTTTTALLGQTPAIDFEKDGVDKAPVGFSFALTGKGRPGAWLVKRDDATHGNVLAQTDADPTDYRFPVAILEGFTAHDVDASVQFKALSGRVDQGAGLVWRYQDANNYYITRCNALEDNCTIYRVVNGSRQAFLNKNVKVATNVWHTLRVQAIADHFVVTYDGQVVLDARDGTFKNAGKVGLWTKADSVIYFDNLSVSGTTPATLAQRLVDEMAKAHPELVRIGLHVTPPDRSDNIIIASNVSTKIGQKSDPEDLDAMKTGKTVVLKEGDNYDITLPLHDAAGRLIGAIGLTMRPNGASRAQLLTSAQSMTAAVERRIPSLAALFKP